MPVGDRRHLAVVGAQQRATFDPGPPSDLQDCMRKWKRDGKAVPTGGGQSKVLPWVSILVVDGDTGEPHHPIDWLDPKRDAEDVILEVWDKVKQRVRYYDDARDHGYVVECTFADFEGNSATEQFADRLAMPRQHAQWGDRGVYDRGRYAQQFRNHPNPHVADASVEAMSIAHGLIHKLVDKYEGMILSQERTIATMSGREADVRKRELEINANARKEKWEDRKQEALVGVLKLVGGRLAKILPMIGLRSSEGILEKFFGKQKDRTARDEDAFEVVCFLAERIEAQLRAQNGGKEVSTKRLKSKLGAMLGIPDDHPVWPRLFKVLLEHGIEKNRRQLEQEASSPVPIEVVVEGEEAEGPKESEGAEEKKTEPAPPPKAPAVPPTDSDSVVRKFAEKIAAEIRKSGFPVTRDVMRMALVDKLGFDGSDEKFWENLWASLERSGNRVFDEKAAEEKSDAAGEDDVGEDGDDDEGDDGSDYDPRDEFGGDDDDEA